MKERGRQGGSFAISRRERGKKERGETRGSCGEALEKGEVRAEDAGKVWER